MPATNHFRRWARSAAIALLAAACCAPARAEDAGVVVLPFRNETKRKDIDFWREGFQELLIQTLAERGVVVARRDAVASAWRAPDAGAVDPQKESVRLRTLLPASVVVTGLFRNGSESVELVVEAWNETRQSRVSAVHQVSAEDALFDAAELQAAAIADGPLPISVAGRGAARPSPEAFHDFVAGAGLRSKERSERLRAVAAFESAIMRSPEWALPYPYLLAAYLEIEDKARARQLLPRARSHQMALPAHERTWLQNLERQLAALP